MKPAAADIAAVAAVAELDAAAIDRRLFVGRRFLESRRVQLWLSALVVAAIAVFVLLVIRPFGPAPQIAGIGLAVLVAMFLAALVCEFIDSSLGMGYGTTMTPLLLIAGFEPLNIVPAVLVSECLSGIFAGLLHHRDGNVDFLKDRRASGTAALLLGLSIVGSVTAVYVATILPKFWLSALITAIVLGIGILILFTVHRRFKYRPLQILALGALASFNKGVSGGGYGPIVTAGQVVSGISPRAAVGISSLAEGLTCLIGFTAYAWLQGMPDWRLVIPLSAGALISVPMATLSIRHIPDTILRTLVGAATLVLGLVALARLLG